MAKKRSEGGYVLPDGTVVDDLTSLVRSNLASGLFNSDVDKNLVAMVTKYMTTDCEIDNRRVLGSNLVFAGGCCMLPFFDKLIEAELLA